MCECTHDEICQDNTRGWMDVNHQTCAWYEKNELPGCPNHGETESLIGGSTANDNCCHCFGEGYGVKPRAVHSVPSARFEFVGEGDCQDVNQRMYDYVQASDVADIELCMSLCSTFAHGGSLVGLSFSENSANCECKFSDGFLKDDSYSMSFDIPMDMDETVQAGLNGVGRVENIGISTDNSGILCYRVSEDTPLLGPTFLHTTACKQGNSIELQTETADEYADRPAFCCQESYYYYTGPPDMVTPGDFHAALAACKNKYAHLCSKEELEDNFWSSVPNCSDSDSSNFLWTCTAGGESCTSNAECCSGLCGAYNKCFYWAMGRDDECAIQ